MKILGLFTILSALLFACQSSQQEKAQQSQSTNDSSSNVQLMPLGKGAAPAPAIQEINDTAFVNVSAQSKAFAYEMRYATTNNFLDKKVYDCSNCLVRYEVFKALEKANDSLRSLGYKIKFFDCFRPVEVQQKMWEIYPDARYVANPNTTGSVHNKGAAVDITLVTLAGDSVNMGTDFDFFGEEAHHNYQNFNADILENRALLKSIMAHFGFDDIRTEWWHYNFNGRARYVISDHPLCEDKG